MCKIKYIKLLYCKQYMFTNGSPENFYQPTSPIEPTFMTSYSYRKKLPILLAWWLFSQYILPTMQIETLKKYLIHILSLRQLNLFWIFYLFFLKGGVAPYVLNQPKSQNQCLQILNMVCSYGRLTCKFEYVIVLVSEYEYV